MGDLSRWAVLIAVFLCIYGALHLYLLIKLRRSFYVEGWSYILLLLVLLFLMSAPVQARLMHHQGYELSALLMYWIGFLWMGNLLLFTCISIPIDLYHLTMATLQQLLNADWTHLMLARRQNVFLTAMLAGALMIYGAVAAYRVPLHHFTLTTAKLPHGMERLRIVHLADLHLGPMTYPGRLGPVLTAVRTAQPDLLVSTGDLVDGPLWNAHALAGQLKALPTPMGKFAVTGNFEFHNDIEGALQFTQSAGFVALRGTAVALNDTLVVAGVDDPAGNSGHGQMAEARLLSELRDNQFAILLKHRPALGSSEGRRFDLQLSGHTHAGQIFPFTLLARWFSAHPAGVHRIGPQHHLHVSRGTGTWGPPIRIGAAPEITIIDLTATTTETVP
ncbi:metallophosphoesterase [Desulfatitalea alkaliphila]|uniref:Metallophosphoesterase n=1 Tax=Desulfatitalea alkaliphila TaxID=2929485 RepID=A0AA41R0Q8_9BACT|nr:metallophosphoesterase [Desulfatitalea alkaliphila]MCJ8499090.1 metallophosphoesterase [Desulfatitalea alkaliphila]